VSNEQENRFAKQVDSIWDAWLNNFKTVQSFQEELQQKALQAFSYQKELIDFSVKSFNTIEEESKKVTKDWTEKVQGTVKDSSIGQDEYVSKWLNSVQEVTESIQSFTWKPSRAFLDLLIESQSQFEANAKKALASQKKERTESYKKVEELIEKVKTAQKEVLTPIKA
jgi:hypothetical protein